MPAQGDNQAIMILNSWLTKHHSVMNRITELSLVAVTRDDLDQLHREVVRYNANR